MRERVSLNVNVRDCDASSEGVTEYIAVLVSVSEYFPLMIEGVGELDIEKVNCFELVEVKSSVSVTDWKIEGDSEVVCCCEKEPVIVWVTDSDIVSVLVTESVAVMVGASE